MVITNTSAKHVMTIVDGPEENSSKLLSTPFVEDPQHRLKWTAYLEFTHNNEVGDLTWDKVHVLLWLQWNAVFVQETSLGPIQSHWLIPVALLYRLNPDCPDLRSCEGWWSRGFPIPSAHTSGWGYQEEWRRNSSLTWLTKTSSRPALMTYLWHQNKLRRYHINTCICIDF